MSKILARIAGYFSNQTFAGIDKAGNRYFSRNVVIDGIMKEKRWVIFKGEDDPTSIPVEWICWLNGQRKRPPTPEEMAELEARRERTRQNVERLKKEEQERKARPGTSLRGTIIGKSAVPDLQSFLRQVPTESGGVRGQGQDTPSDVRTSEETEIEEESQETRLQETPSPRSSEPTGAGPSFKPGTWQPPV